MEHSKVFSFSSASRLIACHASRRLSAGEPNTSNHSAELGTAAHALGEHCLRFGFEPQECEGMTFNNHVVDQNMTDAVTVYTSKIRALEAQTGQRGLLEQRVYMTSLGRNDVFGTSDYILVNGDTVYVADYKHGYGVVEVQDNTQLIAYAIATLDTFNLWGSVNRIVTIVVQPRASHIDGPVRQAEYTTSELREQWWPKYHEAVTQGENPQSPTTPGEHCKYCPASGFCRARINYTLDLIATDSTHHDVMSDAEIEVIYESLGSLRRTLDKVEERALRVANRGYSFKNFKLVRSIVRANCPDEKAFIDAVKSEVGEDKVAKLYHPPKLIGMTAAKKVVPRKIVDKYYVKPEAGTTLVPLNDNRPSLSQRQSAEGVFGDITHG